MLTRSAMIERGVRKSVSVRDYYGKKRKTKRNTDTVYDSWRK